MASTRSEFFCEPCNKSFEKNSALLSHNRSKFHLIKANQLNESNSKLCEKCNDRYLNSGFLIHSQNCKGTTRQRCNLYPKTFTSKL